MRFGGEFCLSPESASASHPHPVKMDTAQPVIAATICGRAAKTKDTESQGDEDLGGEAEGEGVECRGDP
jgi:hypothetical protein